MQPKSQDNDLLCVGSHPNDVEALIITARRIQERVGLQPLFVSVAPREVAEQVRGQARDAGFATLDRAINAYPDATIQNPIARMRRMRAENTRLIDRALSEIRPAAVLSTENPPPRMFLDEAARRGIPTVLLQLLFWADRAFQKAWRSDEWHTLTSRVSRRRRPRRYFERWTESMWGYHPHIEWDLRRTKLAVQGPALRRQLVNDGVPADNVIVTGNPVVDDLHRLRHATEELRHRLYAQLGVQEPLALVTHFRNHEERMVTIAHVTARRTKCR